MKKALLAVIVLTSSVFAQAAMPQQVSCEVILTKNPVYENGEQRFPFRILTTLQGTVTRDGGFERIVTSAVVGKLHAFVNIAGDSTVAGLYDEASGAKADLNVGGAVSKINLKLLSSEKVSVLDNPANFSLELNCK